MARIAGWLLGAITIFAPVGVFAQDVDPLTLPIGRAGTAIVRNGEILDLVRNHRSNVEGILKAVENKPFLYLGESHTNPEHHKFQAQVIEALVKSGRPVVVGFEMFTRPNQPNLDPWTMGMETQDEFIEKADWKHQWGFDYNLYKPIFDVIREDRIPMVALNVPRDWAHSVAKGGFGGLSEEQRKELPSDVGIPNPEHRKVYSAMIGKHPMGSMNLENMYEAQVLWDEGMADSALKYLAAHPQPSNAIFVVLAGAGHLMYGEGINWRIAKRSGKAGVTVIMVDGPGPVKVSRGLGDFVYCGG